MKNTTLSITFNTDKLDALAFHMGKKDAQLQKELTETIQKLYEKYVPQSTREYIDDKVARKAGCPCTDRFPGLRSLTGRWANGHDNMIKVYFKPG